MLHRRPLDDVDAELDGVRMLLEWASLTQSHHGYHQLCSAPHLAMMLTTLPAKLSASAPSMLSRFKLITRCSPSSCRKQIPFTVCHSGTSSTSTTSTPDNSASSQLTPWNFVWDLRERETLWLEENKARLVGIVTRNELGITQEELEDRLDVLLTLVPTLQPNIGSMKPSLLAALLQAPVDQLADSIISLRELFPEADIGAMVAKQPALLLQPRAGLQKEARQLRELLQTDHVDALVTEQPLFMDTACVAEVIKELQVLLNKEKAAVAALLRADPSWLLMAQRGQRWLGQNPDA